MHHELKNRTNEFVKTPQREVSDVMNQEKSHPPEPSFRWDTENAETALRDRQNVAGE